MSTIGRKTLLIYRRALYAIGAVAVLYLALNLD
ncbi:hypothetical protein LMG23994_04527 [Cupriavidus pinatubonensis]|uniref:Uncharacterized protein n=1 Tax=Cupriavidus pinatubonensis TaxID=248026 RepID=A0ABM8XL32_9BURK|nr:hypothetical protein LMG23994_04527 [Cupriavidus pinatubonensis]